MVVGGPIVSMAGPVDIEGTQSKRQSLQENPEWWDIPIVVLTALDLTTEDRRRLNGGIEEILSKHCVTSSELIARVGTLVAEIRAKAQPRPQD